MAKRKPTACDDLRTSLVLEPPPRNPRNWLQLDYVVRAKKFVLTPEAFLRLDELAEGDLLDELVEFALPPFTDYIIESTRDQFDTPALDAVGLPRAMLWAVHDDKLGVIQQESDRGFDISLATATVDEPHPRWTKNHRLVLAFNLLMQSGSCQTLEDKPHSRGLSGNRPTVYMAHSIVTIDLAKPKNLRRHFHSGTHATPRRHEVMGHFIHRGGQRDCIHEWQRIREDELTPRWECTQCERKRTWRAAFERGDAGKGFVRQTYEVIRSEDT